MSSFRPTSLFDKECEHYMTVMLRPGQRALNATEVQNALQARKRSQQREVERQQTLFSWHRFNDGGKNKLQGCYGFNMNSKVRRKFLKDVEKRIKRGPAMEDVVPGSVVRRPVPYLYGGAREDSSCDESEDDEYSNSDSEEEETWESENLKRASETPDELEGGPKRVKMDVSSDGKEAMLSGDFPITYPSESSWTSSRDGKLA